MAYNSTNSPSNVNAVTLAVNMTNEIDKALSEKSVTGFLSDGGLKAKFMGHGIVVLRELNMSAMGDYDRDSGFAKGAITISDVPYQLSQDRGRQFMLDAQDADESGIGDLAGQTMSEFTRVKVIPEMDAYVLSKICGAANAQRHVNALTGGITANTIFASILEDMGKVQDVAGFDEELVCFVDSTVHTALQTTNEITRQLSVTDFKRGDVTTKVQSYNGMAIIPVPSARMMSAYTFKDGKTDGQIDGGFEPADSAKNIGYIIMPKKAANLVKKTEKVRIFNPSQNKDMDAWSLDYRLYYDLFVRNHYKDAIRALTYTK